MSGAPAPKAEGNVGVPGHRASSVSGAPAPKGLSLSGFPLSTVGFVDCVLTQAVRACASDVHIELTRVDTRLRYRLDGMLVKVETGSFLFEQYAAVVARIRILASLDIAEKRLPQDGRFSYVCEHGTVDVRVSILQTVAGERIAMRLLRIDASDEDFGSIGMTRSEADTVERAVRASQGMVLVTGPTGSGKTTTLYTALNYINVVDVNILTVEDPVERRLNGVGQVQVNEAAGLGFARALRAFLRQDPEVILIGEIRDYETADIAFKAALTGHLVLSTLHTMDSVAAIARLTNIGLPGYLVSGAVNLVLAQRLVRVICPRCKISDELQPALLRSMGFTDGELADARLFRGEGCERCSWTGYRGRRGVFEMLQVDEKVRESICRSASGDEISELLAGQGGVNLAHRRRKLLLEGVIDLAEYLRQS